MSSTQPETGAVERETRQTPERAPDARGLGGPGRLVRRGTVLIGLPLFAGWYLWQATEIVLPRRQLVVSPREFPIFVGVLLLLVTVALAIQEIRAIRREATAGQAAPHTARRVLGDAEDEVEEVSSWRDVWVVIGALVAYVLLFSPVGFVVTTFCLLAGLSTYFGRDRWLRNTIVALLFTLAAWYVFRSLLDVQLPAGMLPLGF